MAPGLPVMVYELSKNVLAWRIFAEEPGDLFHFDVREPEIGSADNARS
jgi:hypothetical protein